MSAKYDPQAWGDIGKALALAVLDLNADNPASRLGARAAWVAQRRADARIADDDVDDNAAVDALRKLRISVMSWAESQIASNTRRRAASTVTGASQRGDSDERDDDNDDNDDG